MEIHCPNCKAVYRVDETKIPDKGAYTRCKKCQTRFLVQNPTTSPLSEAAAVDMDSVSDEEKWIQDYIANDNPESAAKLLLDLIIKFAKEKNFSKAESLRNQLDQSIPMALSEIVKANEVIEQEKTSSMEQAHLEIWSDLYGSLNSSETVGLYYAMKKCNLEADQSIFKQGEINQNLYFVEKGALTLAFNHPKEDDPVVLTELEAGSVSNTAGFFLSTVVTFSLKAKTASKIKYLKKDVLLKWEKEFPRMVSELNRFCTTKEDINRLIKNSEKDRRAYERFRVSSKAEVQDLDPAGNPLRKKLKVMLSDISEGGLCYESMITKRESADQLLGNQVIVKIWYQTSAGLQKEIGRGKIVAVNIIPFSKSTIHFQFDQPLVQTVIESIKQTIIEG